MHSTKGRDKEDRQCEGGGGGAVLTKKEIQFRKKAIYYLLLNGWSPMAVVEERSNLLCSIHQVDNLVK